MWVVEPIACWPCSDNGKKHRAPLPASSTQVRRALSAADKGAQQTIRAGVCTSQPGKNDHAQRPLLN